jgi:hypothetical protein
MSLDRNNRNQEIINNYRNDFIKNYGRIRYDKIYEKVSYSKHLRKGIRISRSNNLPLLAGDFLAIGASNTGIFSKTAIIIMGALVAFELWHRELNSDYELASPEKLNIEIGKCLRGH